LNLVLESRASRLAYWTSPGRKFYVVWGFAVVACSLVETEVDRPGRAHRKPGTRTSVGTFGTGFVSRPGGG